MKAIFLLILFLSSCSLFACDLTVRLEEYSAQSQIKHNKWQGLDVELTQLLLDEAKCRYTFEALPWGRSLKLLADGQIDMMLTVSKTPERTAYAHFIGPQRQETLVFASKQMNNEVSSFDKLFALPLPFAVQRGAFYGEAFEHALNRDPSRKQQVIFVTDNQSKVALLKSNRISGYLEAKLNIIFEMEHVDELADLQIHPLVVNQAPVYYAFSKKSVSKRTLIKLSEAYYRLKKQNKFKKLLAKYQLVF